LHPTNRSKKTLQHVVNCLIVGKAKLIIQSCKGQSWGNKPTRCKSGEGAQLTLSARNPKRTGKLARETVLNCQRTTPPKTHLSTSHHLRG
jgi:hypothetical protein|tara:strand:+ start:288 stop:557 length:270 start_codon:yes stop_codon:yes gene_type:complete